MRNSTNLENPINQYSALKQSLQTYLGVLPSAFGIALKPTASMNVHGALLASVSRIDQEVNHSLRENQPKTRLPYRLLIDQQHDNLC